MGAVGYLDWSVCCSDSTTWNLARLTPTCRGAMKLETEPAPRLQGGQKEMWTEHAGQPLRSPQPTPAWVGVALLVYDGTTLLRGLH